MEFEEYGTASELSGFQGFDPLGYSHQNWDLSHFDTFGDENSYLNNDGIMWPDTIISSFTSPIQTQPSSPRYSMSQLDHDYRLLDTPSDLTSSPIDSPTGIGGSRMDPINSEEATLSSPDSGSRPRASRLSQRKRNRIAASKCRRKSKQQEEDLLKMEQKLSIQNKMLSDSIMSLRDEVLDLKSEILKHGSCNCSVIDGYIAKAAREIPGKEGLRKQDPTPVFSRQAFY